MKLLIFTLFYSSAVFSQELSSPTVKLGAEAAFYFELGQMPTSIRGQTQFDFSILQVSPEIKVDEDLSLAFRFVLTEDRSLQKNYVNQMQNGFIRYHDHQYRAFYHEVGLFRSAWITAEGSAEQLQLFGRAGRSLTRRYGFVSEGDLGYQVRYQQSENIEWVGSLANGEENANSEQGPNKEVFFAGFFKNSTLRAQLGLSSGRVDRIDTKINVKNRVYLRLEKTWGRLLAGFEGLYAQDPSLDLETNKRLEAITFTELIDPQRITTYGGRLDLSYDLSEKQKVILRGDLLVPKSEKKRVQSFVAAWVKRESQRLLWGAFYEKTDFGAQHSAQGKVRELVRLGVEVAF